MSRQEDEDIPEDCEASAVRPGMVDETGFLGKPLCTLHASASVAPLRRLFELEGFCAQTWRQATGTSFH